MSSEPRMPNAPRRGDLVLEAVAGQRSVIGFKVHAYLLLEPVALQKAVDRRRIEVVLVRSRLLGLGFDQDLAVKADLVLVLDHQRKKPAHVVELLLHVGIQQGLVALAAAHST